jgi:serine/threonine protein kinase
MSEATDEFDARLLLGRYRVVRKLGQGGMGTVHLARLEGAEGFTKPVVVKRMRPDIRSSEEGNRLFKREAQILSKLHHPGIVNIIDFGIEDGAHIMVLEYVHGYSLAPWLDYRVQNKLPLPVDVCLLIVRKVLDALDYAHHFEVEDGQEVQVVHRDVAPDNVLLSKKGNVYLLDFGVASMSGGGRSNSTRAGVFRGKLGYAAPETVHGQPATPRSDLYSAAVMLLELLTQETPFLSDSMGETIHRMVSEVPPRASAKRDDIPAGLDEVVARALLKDPAVRFESALEFSRELRRVQQADDEEVHLQLRSMVRQDFDNIPAVVDIEPLRVREEALTRALPSGYRAWSADSLSGEEHFEALAADAHRMAPTLADAPIARLRQERADMRQQRSLQRILLGLLVVGGFIALGLGAAVALLSRSGSPEQVVVVGGDNLPRAAASDALSPSSDALAAAPEPSVAAHDTSSAAVRSAQATRPAQLAPSLAPAQTQATSADAEQKVQLSRAVHTQSVQFEGCFTAELSAGRAVHEATLQFTVADTGGKAQVSVLPPAIAQSNLGACLQKAAARISFPRLGETVTFSVPVKARVSRMP